MKYEKPALDIDDEELDRLLRIDEEQEVIVPFPTPANQSHKSAAQSKTLTLKRGSEVETTRIEWLWDGFLARGKPHLIVGAPGTGKTTIGISIVACVTAGHALPDGAMPMTGHVIIWSGEDDPSDTLAPRLRAAGANMDRVHFVDRVDDGGVNRPFDPVVDLDALLVAARKLSEETQDDGGVVLMMVDPIVSAVSGDSHKNAETRRALQPLLNVAVEINVALFGISHFSKGTQGRDPIDRVGGSVAFGAVPRVVMVVAKQQQTSDGTVPQRIFCRAKSNIGPDGGGFTYDIGMAHVPGQDEDFFASTIVWTGTLDGSAREILQDTEVVADDEGSALDDAEKFLREELKQGPVKSKDLKALASNAGHAWATIRRALKSIGAETQKGEEKDAGWEWYLPKSLKPEGQER